MGTSLTASCLCLTLGLACSLPALPPDSGEWLPFLERHSHAIAQNPQDENALGRDRVIDGMTLVFIAAYTVFDMAEIATDARVVGDRIKAGT